jgi:hypothetical protein
MNSFASIDLVNHNFYLRAVLGRLRAIVSNEIDRSNIEMIILFFKFSCLLKFWLLIEYADNAQVNFEMGEIRNRSIY